MIGERTEAAYRRIIKRYEKIKEKSPTEKYEFMKNEGLGLSAIKTNMSAMKWESGNTEYTAIIKSISEEINKQEKHTNKFKKIKWIDFDITGDSVEDVIKGIYTKFPPRRIEDYAFMKYGESEDNYYDDGEFVFRKYKTFRTYGEQRFKVNDELKTIIERYIKKNNILYGDMLLKYNGNKNKPSEKTLQRKLIKIFGVSVDGIRHAYITHLYKDEKELLNIEDISEKMAHNVRTHLRYIDKDNKM